MKVQKYIIPKTHIGIRVTKEFNKIPWKGQYVLGLNLKPKVEYNFFVRISNRTFAIGYHRYW